MKKLVISLFVLSIMALSINGWSRGVESFKVSIPKKTRTMPVIIQTELTCNEQCSSDFDECINKLPELPDDANMIEKLSYKLELSLCKSDFTSCLLNCHEIRQDVLERLLRE